MENYIHQSTFCFSNGSGIFQPEPHQLAVLSLLHHKTSVICTFGSWNYTKMQGEQDTVASPKYCCQVIDGLYLGGSQAVRDLEPLRAIGITHILGAAAKLPVQWTTVRFPTQCKIFVHMLVAVASTSLTSCSMT